MIASFLQSAPRCKCYEGRAVHGHDVGRRNVHFCFWLAVCGSSRSPTAVNPPETGSSSDSFSALASADGRCDHDTSAYEKPPAADRLSDRVRGTRHRTDGTRHCLHEARDVRRRAKARGARMVGALLHARATPRSGSPRALCARDWRRRARPLRERHTLARGSLRARRAIRRTDHQARRPDDTEEAARGITGNCRRGPRPRFERHARD